MTADSTEIAKPLLSCPLLKHSSSASASASASSAASSDASSDASASSASRQLGEKHCFSSVRLSAVCLYALRDSTANHCKAL